MDGNMDMSNGKKGVYDYFIRDYQENIGMILSEESHYSLGQCTMETSRAANEEPVFGQTGGGNEVATTRFTKPTGWTSNTSNSVSKLSKAIGKPIGPNSLLKVMAGDVVNASTQYYYGGAVTNNNNSFVGDVVNNLLLAITGSNVTSATTKAGTTGIGSNLNGSTPFANITDPHKNTTDNYPRAYLSVLFFDERFNFVEEGSSYARTMQAGDGASPLVLANIKAPKNGYAYIYVSNENDEPVYFDNLQVAHNRGRIIEENHYYAYGLKIAGISSKKLGDSFEGMLDNKNLYNDKELIDEGDLNWYDYGFRNYDPQIGRFPQLDPLTDDYPELTNYQFAGDDPIANVDVDGLEAWNILQPVIVTGHATKAAAAAINLTQQALKLTGSFVLGVANAWASNQVLGAGRTDAVKNGLTDRNGVAFQIGQKFGDAYSMITGGSEVAGGAAGEIASIGIATPVAVPLAIHGATAFWNGLYHLATGKIVYTESVNDGGGNSNSSSSNQPKYKNSDKPPFSEDATPGKIEGVKGWKDKKGNFITKGDKPGEWHVKPNPSNRNPLWQGQKPRGNGNNRYWNVKDDGTIHH
jgi:RHS repeat-associated protein